jgi:hypothetical protein
MHPNNFILINTQKKCQVLMVVDMTTLLCTVTHVDPIFRAEDDSIPNEMKVVGNHSAEVCITRVVQQSN